MSGVARARTSPGDPDTSARRAAAILGGRARLHEPLGPRTTYRVGGAAAVLLVAEGIADLDRVAEARARTGLPVLAVGRGSNLLVADSGFPGIAVVLGDGLGGVELAGTKVRAGGAATLPVLARRTAAAELSGLEWAVGVPGSVGGAVRMNAGGHGSDTSGALRSADVFDLVDREVRTVGVAELGLGYRRSNIDERHVVVGATFELTAGDRTASEAEIVEIVRWRRANQPGGPNAGSVFSNPPGDSAGRLIEAAGAKGLRRGSAHVSTKHANFIQADEGGSANDVRGLLLEVAAMVEDRTGVRLEPELRMVGFGPSALPHRGGA
ncbi:MAG: UDP-N-acetylmuramate dehydrogenase [Acidimicrobiales bacterium]